MSIFNIQDARKDIFSMGQFADANFHKDILYFLKMVSTVHIADDKLAQMVYLNRYPIMNPEEMDEEELARLQKLNVKNIRALYVEELQKIFDALMKYFMYLSDHDFRFVIPRKSEKVFREYLNISVKYQVEHASEAFEAFATSIMSPRLYEDYMFVSKADMDILLNRFMKLIGILYDKAKDPLANFFSFDDLKEKVCKRLITTCRMALPVRRDFEYFEEKDPILYKHVRAMNAPYFKIYNTASIVAKFDKNHAFLMDQPIDIPTVGYTEDAALLIVLRAFIKKHISTKITTGEDNAESIKPDTCGCK